MGGLTGAAFDGHALPRERWPVFARRRHPAEMAADRDLPVAQQLWLAGHASPAVRRALAVNPCLDAGVQRILADNPRVRLGLARNPGMCGAVLELLLGVGDSGVARVLAGNADLPPRVLASFAADPVLRRRLAGNPHLPSVLHRELLHDPCEAVGFALAGNPAVSQEVLLEAVGDPRSEVRRGAARNPNLPLRLQARLLEDPHPGVRCMLARHPNLHPAVQSRLVFDGEAVARALARNPAADSGTLQSLLGRAVTAADVAGHPRLGVRQQEMFAGSAEPGVRRRLAGNPALHPGVQFRLASDSDDRTRRILLENPVLDRPALRVLLDAVVQGERLWDPAVRPEPKSLGAAWCWTAASLDHPVGGPLVALLTGRRGLLEAAALHPDPLVRWALVANDRVGGEELRGLMADPEPVIRAGAGGRVLAVLRG